MMKTLTRETRRVLESTVQDARKAAEAGARKAIAQLGVGDARSPAGLTGEELKLRNRLRAHGRQLGDRLDRRNDTQETDRLVSECAYEHWHRMLFARFLAENELLLIEPTDTAAISLADCEELAREQGKDWLDLASSYAQRMLPEIFRPSDPVLQLSLPPETRSDLEDHLKELPREVFTAEDSLGWVYQFWRAEEKDEVNRREVKIGAEEISAVTQLFTEDYMVLFLLHNTLGAWWAGKVLEARPELAARAADEGELRAACAVGDIDWAYLRFVREEEGPWRPAAGEFPGWPRRAKEITLIDPCMGSGHFLVFALPILVAMRVAEERLSVKDAVDAVLRDNLHGLEIDPRCTQIAAFNLAHAAWKRSGYHRLPRLNLACSGLSVGDSKEKWLATLKPVQTEQQQLFYFSGLYDLFKEAPTLGSLINPRRFLGSGLLKEEGQETLLKALGEVLKEDLAATPERAELGVAAEGLARAAELLAGKYTLVSTNVPYLGRSKQDDILKAYLEEQYPLGKADLATAFVLRCLEFCAEGGSTALVTPQNWLFLATYSRMRELLLERREWNMLARLGPAAFETIGGHVVNVALLEFTATPPTDAQVIAGIEATAADIPSGKAALLRGETPGAVAIVRQVDQFDNPDAKILLKSIKSGTRLGDLAVVSEGLHTGDYPRFGRKHWEIEAPWNGWAIQQGGTGEDSGIGGCEHILFWENGAGELINFVRERLGTDTTSMWIKGEEVWGKQGLAVGAMSDLKHTPYVGALFTHGIVAIVPKRPDDLPAITCYVESPEFRAQVRLLDQKVCVARASFENVRLDLANWRRVAAEKYSHGVPDPESDDPTQWLFHGRPEHSTAPLQVAVARLVGFRWPAEVDPTMGLSKRARDLVKQCKELLPLADEDGIVCLPALRGEPPAADRVLAMLLKCGIRPDLDLARWLRDDFFKEQCELFHQRPFVWHIWDGRQDGFAALVNYHKLAGPKGLGKKTLDSLIYSYLGDWISQQRAAVARDEEGADARLAAATKLQQHLIKIAKGESPFDLFVRWKPLHAQPIGWEPDINDGVRLNIRPFLAGDLPGGRKGAGVFRTKPSIKWSKDRGKEPERPKDEYPWFWGWNGEVDFAGASDFTGDRWNDCHYTIAFKEAVRARRQSPRRSAAGGK